MHGLEWAFVPAAVGLVATASWQIRAAATRRRLSKAAPFDFDEVPGADGLTYASASFAGASGLVLVFMSNRCPGVKAYDKRLREIWNDYAPRGVEFLGINAIDGGMYPAESLTRMAVAARERRIPFPYVKDVGQTIMRKVGAVATPQVFVFDARRRLRYAGKIDDSFLEKDVSREYLREALEAVLDGRKVPITETAPLGCAIDPEDGANQPLHLDPVQAKSGALA